MSAERFQRAHELYQAYGDWDEVGERMCVTSQMARHFAMEHTKKTGICPNGVPKTTPETAAPRRTKVAYEAIMRGETYPEVAKGLDFRDVKNLYVDVAGYARRKGLTVPPLTPHLSRLAYRAYRLRQRGKPWKEVGEAIDESEVYASKIAKIFARDEQLEWPIGSGEKNYQTSKPREGGLSDADMEKAEAMYRARLSTYARWKAIGADYGLEASKALTLVKIFCHLDGRQNPDKVLFERLTTDGCGVRAWAKTQGLSPKRTKSLILRLRDHLTTEPS